jgi:uncharacterized protein YggE
MADGHGFRNMMLSVLVLLCGAIFASPLQAGEPGISVAASSSVQYYPDTAEFTTAVETVDKDAAKAAAKVAMLWNTLQQALRKAGISSSDASSAGYTVSPEWEWNRSNGNRVFKGYKARHVVRVIVRDLRTLGGAIDAVVGAGAGNVDGLRYFSSQYDNFRMQALENAVKSAKRDAELMARSAGGRLGSLLELEYGQTQPDYPVMRAVMADGLQAEGAPPTEVQPAEQKLTVSVSSRWAFVSGSGK